MTATHKTDLDLANEMLAHLVLSSEAARKLTMRLAVRQTVREEHSIVEAKDSLLASDSDSEEGSQDGTPPPDTPPRPSSPPESPALDVATNAPTSAATAVSAATPTSAATAATAAPTPAVGTQASADASRAPALGLSVQTVDPTGPHHLFVVGGVSLDGRTQRKYNDFIFDVPFPNESGQLYLVTRGRRVGIFTNWSRTSPYVIGVSFATYSKVPSLDQGVALLMAAIDLGEAHWLA